MRRARILGGISEEPDRLTRRFGTPAMRQANRTVAAWMSKAGMSVRQDGIGNLIGRYQGSGSGAEQFPSRITQHPSPTLILGSHLDTVRDAGMYDGPLGVLVAIACVERLHEQMKLMPFNIEVVAFADEEGLRFHTAYLGSKVYAGSFDPAYLDLTDDDGITLREAIRTFGGDPDTVRAGKRAPEGLLGYCEVHIEQGPVLEAEGLPVGIVSSIAGQSRFSVRFVGEAGHAGTVPMRMRRDALCAAAEFITAAESLAIRQEGLVATVGQAKVEPGASNVIPGQVTISLDVRHLDDPVREAVCERMRERADQIALARNVSIAWEPVQATRSVPCSPHLAGLLAKAVEEAGYSARHLPSGAGHDAVTMSGLTEVAMLFVRCKGGISHNPAESVSTQDVAVAIQVMDTFLELLASRGDR